MQNTLQEYMDQHIPLAKFMQIKVESVAPEGNVFTAPLGPNINDKGIAFGGSLASLATLVAWSEVFKMAQEKGVGAEIVIADSQCKYLAPGKGNLKAVATPLSEDLKTQFWERYDRKSRASATISSYVESDGERVFELTGRFALISGYKESL
jgi:thioesterase domain-containing protein